LILAIIGIAKLVGRGGGGGRGGGAAIDGKLLKDALEREAYLYKTLNALEKHPDPRYLKGLLGKAKDARYVAGRASQNIRERLKGVSSYARYLDELSRFRDTGIMSDVISKAYNDRVTPEELKERITACREGMRELNRALGYIA